MHHAGPSDDSKADSIDGSSGRERKEAPKDNNGGFNPNNPDGSGSPDDDDEEEDGEDPADADNNRNGQRDFLAELDRLKSEMAELRAGASVNPFEQSIMIQDQCRAMSLELSTQERDFTVRLGEVKTHKIFPGCNYEKSRELSEMARLYRSGTTVLSEGAQEEEEDAHRGRHRSHAMILGFRQLGEFQLNSLECPVRSNA